MTILYKKCYCATSIPPAAMYKKEHVWRCYYIQQLFLTLTQLL